MRRAALLLLALATPAPVLAAGLAGCLEIAADAERLACYDRAAGRTPPPAPTAVPGPAAPAAAARGFGAEDLPRADVPGDTPDEIRARLVGRLDRWKKGMEFTLDNGQVWRCIDDRKAEFREIADPAVTLRRNFIGNYFMEIEGVYLRPRVRRVR